MLAFERGGLTPLGGPTLAVLHPRGMVLPAPVTEKILGGGVTNNTGHTFHKHYHGYEGPDQGSRSDWRR